MRPQVTKNALALFEGLRRKELEVQEKLHRAFLKNEGKSQAHRTRLKQTADEIIRLRKVDLHKGFGFFVRISVEHAEYAKLYMNEQTYRGYVWHVLENKFKCASESQKLRAFREFFFVIVTLLDHPLGLDGPKVVFDLEDDAENHFAFTRPFFNSKTVFSSAIIRDAILVRDYVRDLRHADSQLLLKSMIHEAVHRLSFIEKDRAVPSALRQGVQALNELMDGKLDRVGEVYEDDHPDAFRKLTLDEHLQNADSYRSFIMGMSAAYQRTKNARVESPQEQATADQVRVIYEGDTLWDIANDFYGDGRLWERLWQANKAKLRSGDPHKIFPGETLIVPLD